MKHILFAVLVTLSLATVGWAGEPSSNCTADLSPVSEECQKQAVRDRLKWAAGDTNEYQWQKLPDGSIRLRAQTNCVEPSCRPAPDCLARMEKAMKAGQPYIFDGETFSYPVVGTWPPVPGTQEQLGATIVEDSLKQQMYARLADLTALWSEAKQCWIKP